MNKIKIEVLAWHPDDYKVCKTIIIPKLLKNIVVWYYLKFLRFPKVSVTEMIEVRFDENN